MNIEMAHRVQMMPAKVRAERWQVVAKLRGAGWSQDDVDAHVDAAIAWAKSHCLTVAQEKSRKARSAKKTRLKGDDALDLMFSSVGADPATIPRKDSRHDL